MTALRKTSSYAPVILNHGARWRRVDNFMHWWLYRQLKPPVPIE